MSNKFDLAEGLISCMEEDCAFDQPCKFGHRVGGHSVYCHNDEWENKPRKCRRTWFSGGKYKDEDCEGFQPNPNLSTNAPSKGCNEDSNPSKGV